MGGVLAPRADPNRGSGPVPLRERVDSSCVSLLGLAFSYLCPSPFLNVSMLLCSIPSELAAPRGGSPYLRMWRGGRPIMSIVNDCGHRGKVDGGRRCGAHVFVGHRRGEVVA
jgi:hypothetical protein